MTEEFSFEEHLIGAMLLDPTTIDIVSGLVSQRDFTDAVLGNVFTALVLMRDAKEPTNDISLVAKKLKPTGIGNARIAKLFGSGTAAHAKHYAGQVAELASRRRLRKALSEAINFLDANEVTAQEAAAHVEVAIEDNQSRSELEFISLADSGRQLLDEVGGEVSRKPSCFSGIRRADETVGGFRPGEMVVLAARPGVGKTSLAMQFAYYNASQNRAGLFVSLEMTRTELAGRMLCGLTEVDSQDLRTGRLGEMQKKAIANKIVELNDLKLFIWDPPAANINRIRAIARVCNLRHDISFIAVDYIGLVDAVESNAKRHQAIGEVSRKLKQLAKELECPVFVLCQLNRDADGQVPTLSNLRDSGSIEQDADAVIFLHPTDPEKQTVDLIVAKHRHGETGAFELEFDKKRTTFVDNSVGRTVDQLPFRDLADYE